MSQFYNNLKTVFLLGALTGLILLIGRWLGGGQGVVIALIFAGIMNFVSYFFSDKIALMSVGAHEVGPDNELYGIVQELARKSNLPMPRVYIADQAAPNAFATGRNPHHAAVCATVGLLRMLNRQEIAGVLAHEMAHVKHRDVLITTIAATIAGAISALGYMFFWGGMGRSNDREGGNPLAGLLVLILGPLAAGLIQAAISRSREFNADKEGAEIVGDPMPLATALEKITLASQRLPLEVNPAFNSLFIAEPLNAMESIGNMFNTHPTLAQRLINLIGRPSTGQVGYSA